MGGKEASGLAVAWVSLLVLGCLGVLPGMLEAATVTEDSFADVTGVSPTQGQEIQDNPPNNIMHTCSGAKLVLDKQNGGTPEIATVYIRNYIYIDTMEESKFYNLDTFHWAQAEEGKKTHAPEGGPWSVAHEQAVGEHWYKGKKDWQRQPKSIFPTQKGAKTSAQMNYEIVEESAGDPSFLQGDRRDVFYLKHDRR